MIKIKYGLAWNNSYKIGNEQVDSQHYQLFVLLSELVSFCMSGSDKAKLQETLDFLLYYTTRHFEDEEVLQIQCGYPDYQRHKQLHHEFRTAVDNLVKRFAKNGSSAELSYSVNRLVITWLLDHIQQEDKKIGEFLNSRKEIAT